MGQDAGEDFGLVTQRRASEPKPRHAALTRASGTKAGEFGQFDLFVSFRAADGRWGEPVNLGNTINTAATEFCPTVTPDGRYLFVSRRFGGTSWETTTHADVYCVDIAVVERLRPREVSVRDSP